MERHPQLSRRKVTDNWGTRSQFPVPEIACASVKRGDGIPLRAGNMAQQTASSTIHQLRGPSVLPRDALATAAVVFSTPVQEPPTTARGRHTMKHELSNGRLQLAGSSLDTAGLRRCALPGRGSAVGSREGSRCPGSCPAGRSIRARLELAGFPCSGSDPGFPAAAAALAGRPPGSGPWRTAGRAGSQSGGWNRGLCRLGGQDRKSTR